MASQCTTESGDKSLTSTSTTLMMSTPTMSGRSCPKCHLTNGVPCSPEGAGQRSDYPSNQRVPINSHLHSLKYHSSEPEGARNSLRLPHWFRLRPASFLRCSSAVQVSRHGRDKCVRLQRLRLAVLSCPRSRTLATQTKKIPHAPGGAVSSPKSPLDHPH